MKYSQWIGLFAAAVVAAVCFMPWIVVPSAHVEVGGVSSAGTQNFGKPGLINLACAVVAAWLFLMPRVWAKRTNMIICGLNVAWAFRNYSLMGRCYLGDCPVILGTLYGLVLGACLMLLMSLFPDIKISPAKLEPGKEG